MALNGGLPYFLYTLEAFFSSLMNCFFFLVVSFFAICIAYIHCCHLKMMYVCLIGDGMVVKTYGNEDLQFLIDMTLAGMPIGFSYRFISKGTIMRIEVLSPAVYVAIFTNLDNKRHSWVIRKVLDQIDQDTVDSEDEITDI